jgi:hypothetical protein
MRLSNGMNATTESRSNYEMCMNTRNGDVKAIRMNFQRAKLH